MSGTSCSFCGKSDDQYGERRCFVGSSASPPVFICHRCVVLCNDILASHRARESCDRCRDGTLRPLSKRQAQIIAFVREFIAEHEFAPSFEEIAEHFSYRSLATVHEHLTNIQRKGWIRRRYNEFRSIELVSASPSSSSEKTS